MYIQVGTLTKEVLVANLDVRNLFLGVGIIKNSSVPLTMIV